MLPPDIQLSPQPSDKVLLHLSYYLVIVLFLVNGLELYLNINVSVPFLTKYKMLFLSIFGLIIAVGGKYLVKYPQYLNHRKEITAVNAEQEYRKTALSIRWLVIFVLFSLSVISMVAFFQQISHISNYRVYFLLTIIVCMCFVYFLIIYRSQKKKEITA